MKKLFKIFAVAALVITASVANAQIDRDTGIGIGAAIWYSQNCESYTAVGEQSMLLFLASENITELNIAYQPGIIEGFDLAETYDCPLTKFIMQDSGMYDLLF